MFFLLFSAENINNIQSTALVAPTIREWSTQATSFRPNPFHANYFLNVYNLSSMHLNKILLKPIRENA